MELSNPSTLASHSTQAAAQPGSLHEFKSEQDYLTLKGLQVRNGLYHLPNLPNRKPITMELIQSFMDEEGI